MPDNPSFDGQTWTCLTPGWPKEKCENAAPRRNGECMYLREHEENRCDNLKNATVHKDQN